jgi:hypothetical protein
MSFEKKYVQTSKPTYSKETNQQSPVKNMYYGEVVSITDPTEGGRIKVRIADLDDKTLNNDLPWAYPAIPKFVHIYPQVGEVVRVFLEDIRYPQRGRHWAGSVISQLPKIGRDGYLTALSTTNVALGAPDKAPSQYPDAKGVFPDISDIGLIGRDNTELMLKPKQVLIRAGRHEVDNILALNRNNPATIQMDISTDGKQSSIIHLANKIALITHEGNPKFPATNYDAETLERVFKEAHPMSRGDILVQILEIFRKAIIQHIHGYSGIAADKNEIIVDLEKIDLTQILQNNIRIN